MTNKNLNFSKQAKNDLFFTQIEYIEKELLHYINHFNGKTIYCNCDDPIHSNFWLFFAKNFEKFNLKRLIATTYNVQGRGIKHTLDHGKKYHNELLNFNGDFRNKENISILKEADIVVTNPPFSLFREYISQLIDFGKNFIILGSINMFKYKEIFPYIKNNYIHLGVNSGSMVFEIPKETNRSNTFVKNGKHYAKFGNICWYTSFKNICKKPTLTFSKLYNKENYKFFETFEAINVDNVKDIPVDYGGAIGVPISFLPKYNSNKFKILGILNHGSDSEFDLAKPIVDGRELYARLIIQRIQ